MDKGEKKLNSDFLELLTPNYYKIHSFVLTLIPNKADAEDVLQSSITYMWEHFEDFTLGTNFLSWAFTVAKYHALTQRKKQSRSRIRLSKKAMQLIEAENRRLANDMDIRHEALAICMKKLSHEDLMYVKKRFEENNSIKNLASEIGISVNVAYKRISRIKMLLLSCIRKAISSMGEAL